MREPVTVVVGAVTSRIIGDFPSEFHSYTLRHTLSYEDKAAFHKQKVNKYIPDRKYLITEKRMEFRTGLLDRVCRELENISVDYVVQDNRQVAEVDNFMPLNIEEEEYFRDYQLEGIKIAIAKRSGMLRVATGGGKTSMICGLAARLERNCIILVHRLDLLRQVHETLLKFMQYPEVVGRVGGGIYEPSMVTVCTVQTLCAALGVTYEAGSDDDDEKPRSASIHRSAISAMLSKAQVVIVDEAHHAPARTISEVLRLCGNATWRIGFTATDWRDDGADLLLEAAIGPRIFDKSLSDLIALGWLVPADVYMYPQAAREYECESTHWQTLYKYYYTENQPFHEQVVNLNSQWYEAGRHILTLVTQIEHGKKLQRMHREAGMECIFLSGQTPEHQRKQILSDVIKGRMRCLIGTSVADEGLDMPILDALNLAGGGRSTTKVYQRIGRTLRPFGDKKEALILDYRCPDEKLNKHSGRRANIYRHESGFRFKEIKASR